jgi:hypothetical protein
MDVPTAIKHLGYVREWLLIAEQHQLNGLSLKPVSVEIEYWLEATRRSAAIGAPVVTANE